MGHLSAEQIAQRAFDLGLLDERQLQEIWAGIGSRNVALNDFLQILVRREFLTNYQVERLVKGDRGGFFYGPYKVLYLVGSGSFARVFRAVHRDTAPWWPSRSCAIASARTRSSSASSSAKGRSGCTLRHPNIVPIFEVISEGKAHFLVMEFVEGWNLREFVKIRKKIDPVQATRLAIGHGRGPALRLRTRPDPPRPENEQRVGLDPRPGETWWTSAWRDRRRRGRRSLGRQAQRTDHRLRGPGAGHRRAQGRYPQRHLLPGLHLLQHAHRRGRRWRKPAIACNA